MYEIKIVSKDKREVEGLLKQFDSISDGENIKTIYFPEFSLKGGDIHTYYLRIFFREEKIIIKLRPINIKGIIIINAQDFETLKGVLENIENGFILIDCSDRNSIEHLIREIKETKKNFEIYTFNAFNKEKKCISLLLAFIKITGVLRTEFFHIFKSKQRLSFLLEKVE